MFNPIVAHDSRVKQVTSESICVVVSTGGVYVLGDNRVNLVNSRSVGPITELALVGKVISKISKLGHSGDVDNETVTNIGLVDTGIGFIDLVS